MPRFLALRTRTYLVALRGKLSEAQNARVLELCDEVDSDEGIHGKLLAVYLEFHERLVELDRLILARTSTRELRSRASSLPDGIEKSRARLELSLRESRFRPYRETLVNLLTIAAVIAVAFILCALYVARTQP
jgi:enoyl-CoA hydratase/carnithine racemase